MKTILSLKKHQMIIIAILVICFAFSASSVLAFSKPLLRISEPEIIKETEPMIEPGFIPIGKSPSVEYPVYNPPQPTKIVPVNLSIDRLFNEKFSITKIANGPAACVTPTAGMEITTNTTLCSGEHIYTPSGSFQFIKITANNVTLDCDGAILSTTGNEAGGWPAIVVPGTNLENITIKNCNINEFVFPVKVTNANYITLSNITYNYGSIQIFNSDNGEYSYLNKPIDSNGNNYTGSLHLADSHYNNIHDNAIYHSFGISLMYDSSYNLVHNNSLGYLPNPDEYTNDFPASFYIGGGANNNEFYDNEIIENSDDGLYGITIYGEDDPENNTVENKIYNNAISNNYVGILLSEKAANNEIYENTISDNDYSFYLFDSASDNIIYNNAISNSYIAIELKGNSTNNEIYGNNITNSSWNSILMWPFEDATDGWGAPHDNNVRDNFINNGFRDIVITNLVNDNIFDNNTFNNTSDIAFFIYRNSSPSSKAIGNEFINNTIIGTGNTGIEIHNNASQNHRFEKNHIKNRTNAGIIIGSGNNGGYLLINNFVNNTIQVIDHSDNTYDHIVGGNFWSDFDEPIEGCNDINLDGKCDEDYYGIIGTGGNIDSQPFTGAPTLEPIENISINELNNAIIDMEAEDPQGDELTYSVDDDRFFSMDGCWPGTHAFRWVPNEYQAGSYTVNATVTDGVHEVSYPVSVNVANTCQINKWGKMVCSSYFEHLACY